MQRVKIESYQNTESGWHMDKFYHVPAPKLKIVCRRSGGREVTYPVSYSYNGGIRIDGEWYQGYEVDPPIVPKGFHLVSICVGLQHNAYPPLATELLVKD